MATIAEKLNEAKLEKGILVYDMSAQTGINASSIKGYLSGENEPRAHNLCLLADVLDVSVDWLLDRTDVVKGTYREKVINNDEGNLCGETEGSENGQGTVTKDVSEEVRNQ